MHNRLEVAGHHVCLGKRIRSWKEAPAAGVQSVSTTARVEGSQFTFTSPRFHLRLLCPRTYSSPSLQNKSLVTIDLILGEPCHSFQHLTWSPAWLLIFSSMMSKRLSTFDEDRKVLPKTGKPSRFKSSPHSREPNVGSQPPQHAWDVKPSQDQNIPTLSMLKAGELD